jgi:CelD/BcsL family acetyltransferase involved in cellulose biosynthesis
LAKIPEKWQYIDLNDIPENSRTLNTISQMSNEVKLAHPCPYASLPKSYETFMKGPNGKKRFTDVSRHFKSLQKSFELQVSDCSGVESFSEGMESLFRLHQRRWTARGLSGAFASPRFRSFHLDVAESFAKKDWLGLFLLKLSGNPAAALYGFKYNSKYYLYLTGFSPKYAKYGVGNVLIASVIRECIDDGLVEFDFMRGDESYKIRWSSTIRWNRQAIITEPNSLSRMRYWILRKYWNRGKELKSLLNIQ